ncbi:MAG: 4Fe-4S dicluster domain-containing protein, partial [Acidimicrobiales bacterium]
MTLTDSATTSTPSVGKPSKDSRVPAKPHVHVLLDRCAGCQECIIRCPAGALHLDPVTWTAFADDDACVGCRQCVRTCPFSAILVEGPMLVAPRSTLGTEHPAALLHNSTETRH